MRLRSRNICILIPAPWDKKSWKDKCKKDKRNQVVPGFQEIKLDSTGHVVAGEWDETKVYSKYHTAEKLAEAQLSAGNSLTTLVHAAQMEIVNVVDEVYVADEIWEQMIRQAWLDIVKTINRKILCIE